MKTRRVNKKDRGRKNKDSDLGIRFRTIYSAICSRHRPLLRSYYTLGIVADVRNTKLKISRPHPKETYGPVTSFQIQGIQIKIITGKWQLVISVILNNLWKLPKVTRQMSSRILPWNPPNSELPWAGNLNWQEKIASELGNKYILSRTP